VAHERSLHARVEEILDAWDLHPDGPLRSGEAGIVVPVRRADGLAAAVKIQRPGPEADAAILGLSRWDGRGIVRLLASAPDRGAMLLERLDAERSLEAMDDDDDATRIVGSLLARLHSVDPPAGLPRLEAVASQMLDDATEAGALLTGEDRRRFDRWRRLVADVAATPGSGFLHWDLHFGNVLHAEREPWLAIDPEPLVGDAGFDLWPALDSGWSRDPGTVDAGRIVRRRFDILTEMLHLDRARAARWTTARLLQNALWDIEDGEPAIAPAATVLDDALRSAGLS